MSRQRSKHDNPVIRTFESPRPVHNLEIVVLVPVSPRTEEREIDSCIRLVERAATPFRLCRLVLDSTGTPPPTGKPHPYRQEALARIRQDMVDKYLGAADWVAWIDVDIIDYPANLLSELISRADGGIAAPVVLTRERSGSGKVNGDALGRVRFFDVAGFVEGLRWARFEEPWFDQPGPEYSLDSVGGCYVVNAEIYRQGARHTPDSYSLDFIRRGLTWGPETLKMNQERPANCFTEHFSVCQWAKQHSFPVRAYGDLIALHASVGAHSGPFSWIRNYPWGPVLWTWSKIVWCLRNYLWHPLLNRTRSVRRSLGLTGNNVRALLKRL